MEPLSPELLILNFAVVERETYMRSFWLGWELTWLLLRSNDSLSLLVWSDLSWSWANFRTWAFLEPEGTGGLRPRYEYICTYLVDWERLERWKWEKERDGKRSEKWKSIYIVSRLSPPAPVLLPPPPPSPSFPTHSTPLHLKHSTSISSHSLEIV